MDWWMIGLEVGVRERLLITPTIQRSITPYFGMVPEVGSAPTSPPLQGGANLPQLLGGMVVPAGNAPASPGYRPGALLLSYRTEIESRGARLGRLSTFWI